MFWPFHNPIEVALYVWLCFVWGFWRATRFRSRHGRSPWGLAPLAWGAVVCLCPIGLLWIAGRTTRFSIANSGRSLAHGPVGTASTVEIWAGPAPAGGRGWHEDPSGRHALRYFDGSRWTSETIDNDRPPRVGET